MEEEDLSTLSDTCRRPPWHLWPA